MRPSLAHHPCFNHDATATHARVHLPVAPACNIQCNYCNRKYDCVNESRPGVTSAVLNPEEAARYLDRVCAKAPHLAVAGIAGPGDPFADPARTLDTLARIHAAHPDLLLCLASNGLGLYDHIGKLAALGVSHITLTVNAVDPAIGAQLYAWVQKGAQRLYGIEAAQTLLTEQLRCIPALKAAGLLVKINAVLVPGVNDPHLPEVARRVKALGADTMNLIPLLVTQGTAFENRPTPTDALTAAVRAQVAEHITVLSHCRRCRADAVGLLGHDDPALRAELQTAAERPAWISPARPRVAVATNERLLINGHLGAVAALHIFEKRPEGRFGCIGVRTMPPAGGGDTRWRTLAAVLCDCSAVVVSGAGSRPEEVLAEEGLLLVRATGLIDPCLHALYTGGDLASLASQGAQSCGGGGACCGGKTTACCA
jgi:nitrogen fixation protein NifB